MNTSVLHRYREVFSILATATALFLVVYFGGIRWYNDIRVSMDRSQELAIDSELRDRLASNIETVREQNEMIDINGKKLQRVIAKKDIVVLIENIERLASETKNEIRIESNEQIVETKVRKTVSSEPGKSDASEKSDSQKKDATLLGELPGASRVTMTISIVGTYENILQFLRKMETLSYENDIVSISIATKLPENDTYTGTGNVFWVSSDGNVPPPPTNKPLSVEAKLETIVYVLPE